MKTTTKLFFAIFFACFAMSSANAYVINVDPDKNSYSLFWWNKGIGPIQDTFHITVNGPSYISLSVSNSSRLLDNYALTLDGYAIDWTSVSSYYRVLTRTATDIYLGAGEHQFDIFVTDSASDIGSGYGTVFFGAVTPAVPEPQTYAMLLFGLGVAGLARRKFKKTMPH